MDPSNRVKRRGLATAPRVAQHELGSLAIQVFARVSIQCLFAQVKVPGFGCSMLFPRGSEISERGGSQRLARGLAPGGNTQL